MTPSATPAPGQHRAALNKTVHKLKAQRPRPSHHVAFLDSDRDSSNEPNGSVPGSTISLGNNFVKVSSELKVVPSAENDRAESREGKVVAEALGDGPESSTNEVREESDCRDGVNLEPEWLAASSPYFRDHSEDIDANVAMATQAGIIDEEESHRQLLAAVRNDLELSENSFDLSEDGRHEGYTPTSTMTNFSDDSRKLPEFCAAPSMLESDASAPHSDGLAGSDQTRLIQLPVYNSAQDQQGAWAHGLDSYSMESCLSGMEYSSAGASPTSSEDDEKLADAQSWPGASAMNVDPDIPALLNQYIDGPVYHEDLWNLEHEQFGLENC